MAYPRSHGATILPASMAPAAIGLSPLARGNPADQASDDPLSGPIPARTGQPELLLGKWLSDTAYPRSHGATTLLQHPP